MKVEVEVEGRRGVLSALLYLRRATHFLSLTVHVVVMSTTSLHCVLPSLGHPTPLLHPTSHWNRGVNLGLTHGWVGWDGIYQRVTLRPAPISPLSSLPSLTTVNDYTIQTPTKRLNISLVSNSITIFPFLICTCICICSILHRLNST